jgi:hypothetical protein
MIDSLGNLDVTKTGGKVSKMDTAGLPGFSPNSAKNSWNPNEYRVKYKRVNVQDADDISELERIETSAIRGDGIYVLGKEKFTFMDQILILVQYLEKIE